MFIFYQMSIFCPNFFLYLLWDLKSTWFKGLLEEGKIQKIAVCCGSTSPTGEKKNKMITVVVTLHSFSC